MNAHTQAPVDPWSHWRDAIAARKQVDMPVNEVALGYYRARDGECVAFLPDGAGHIYVWRTSDWPPPKHWDAVVELFAKVCLRPVSHEDATHYGEHGRWPEEVAPVEVDASLPPHEQADAKITAQRAAMVAWLKETGEIKTQEQADKCGNFADTFHKIWQEAEAARKAEKKPHDEAGAAVQKKWVPVVDRANELKVYAKKATEPFLIAEKARIAAEEKAAAEARAKAAREAKEAADAAAIAAASAAAAAGEPAPLPVAAPAPVFAPPPQKAKAGRVHLRTRTVHEITDMRKFLAHLADMNEIPREITDAFQLIVNRWRFAGVEVPGVEAKTVEGAA
jgi:hypothetical protein